MLFLADCFLYFSILETKIKHFNLYANKGCLVQKKHPFKPFQSINILYISNIQKYHGYPVISPSSMAEAVSYVSA